MPPLTLKTSYRGEWECTTCSEDYDTTNEQSWETADGRSLVCAGCIIQQFEKALKNDLSWPARFGGARLNIGDFESILPANCAFFCCCLRLKSMLKESKTTPDWTLFEIRPVAWITSCARTVGRSSHYKPATTT
jgi:hypothetical protein